MLEMDDTIKLDRRSFEALAAESRVKILKALSKRRKTLTELAKELSLSNSTMKEHLEVLVGAGLILQRDEGRKWKYYELTRKGRGIVGPYPARVLIMLAVSIILVLGSGWNFMNAFGPPVAKDVVAPLSEAKASAESARLMGGTGKPRMVVGLPMAYAGNDRVLSSIAAEELESYAEAETAAAAPGEETGDEPAPGSEAGFPYPEGIALGLSLLLFCTSIYLAWKGA
jgi:DNA-binding transcriptional ArsR family regulator